MGNSCTVTAPKVCSWARPRTRVMPSGLPESSFVAKFPNVQITRGRVTVPWWPALQHVGDVHLLSRQPDLLKQRLQQSPCLADERDSLLVLVEAGSLTHEHQVGVGLATADHHLGAAAGQGASLTARPFSRPPLQLLTSRVRIDHGPDSGRRVGRIRSAAAVTEPPPAAAG